MIKFYLEDLVLLFWLDQIIFFFKNAKFRTNKKNFRKWS
jgi:hypothetical protein